MEHIRDHLIAGGCGIMLVDANILRGVSGKLPTDFKGHFIFLVGSSNHENPEDVLFYYLDPSISYLSMFKSVRHSIGLQRLDEARVALGTDQDIILISRP